MSKVNGVLSKIAAEHRGAHPPQATSTSKSPHYIETDVPGLGRVRITYELYSYVHRGKNKFWAWRGIWADKI